MRKSDVRLRSMLTLLSANQKVVIEDQYGTVMDAGISSRLLCSNFINSCDDVRIENVKVDYCISDSSTYMILTVK